MILIALVLIFVLGYGLSGVFLRKSDTLERLSLSFVMGLGVFTLLLFLINLAGIPLNSFSVITSLVIITIPLFGFLHKPKFNLEYFKNLDLSEKIILSLIVFLIVSSFIGSLYFPVRHWDSLTLYDFRAKILASSGSIYQATLDSSFVGYPLLTTLAHTVNYVLNFSNPSYIYSLFYISLVTGFFVNLKKLLLRRNIVFFLTLLVSVSPRIFDHSLSAYTNLPYLTYLVFGSIYLYFGIKNKHLGSFMFSALLIGLSTWTRSVEPFWITYLALAAIFSLKNKKWLWIPVYIALFLLVMLPWTIFQSTFNVGIGDVAARLATGEGSNLNYLGLIIPVTKFIWTNVMLPNLGYFLLLILAIVYKFVKKSKSWLFVILIIINLGLIFVGTFVLVKFATYWQDIPDSLTRLSLFIPPMIVFLCGELLSDINLISPIKAEPWITFGAKKFIDNFLDNKAKVFEWGSGGSTLYFLNRVGELVSVEHDPGWYKRVSGQLKVKLINYALVRPQKIKGKRHRDYVSSDNNFKGYEFSDYCLYINKYPDKYFDLILIDGRARVGCIENAYRKINSRGVIVLDNSERDVYKEGVSFLLKKGFKEKKYFGKGPINNYNWQTSVFSH